ncbi:MAG: serine/threonine-protein kinase [Thermoanaerobaculia bacterium]|nr:serine/threonine-protein kinase [Thermoanaerobaculia bacterium]
MSFDITETLEPGEAKRGVPAMRPTTSLSGDALGRGVTIGRYLVLEPLGQGGMGSVYSAFDPELDRTVALKIVRADLQRSESARARLVREARSAARLSHPCLVEVYDAGTLGDLFFLAMERIEGRDLARVLVEEDLPWRQILSYFLAAGEGLRATHEAGLVHRDFKPANVMLGDDGRVRLVDFGLARQVVEFGKTSANSRMSDGPAPSEVVAASVATHGTGGTPTYMSPEQLRGDQLDDRSDQFSYCVALYEALYGQSPFSDDDPMRQEVLSPPAASDVPAWVRQPILRGLANDPADRFEDMVGLLTALRNDPRGLRLRLLATALGVSVLAISSWLAYRVGDMPTFCGEAETKLEGLWDDERKKQLRQTILASDLATAQDAWRLVERQLDDYTSRWTDMHVAACEATRRGEQTEQLFDLQIGCLETRLFDVSAAVSLLSEGGVDTVRNAGRITRLPNLTGCQDRDVLLNLEPPPADPAVTSQVSGLRRELSDLRSRVSAGRLREALSLTEDIVARAEAMHYAPLSAEAHLVAAGATAFSGQFDTGREHYLASAGFALASRHDELLARVLISLTMMSRVAGDESAALTWAELADAAVRRLGDRADLRADHDFSLGMVSAMQGKQEAAIAYFRSFLRHPIGTQNRPEHAYHNIAKAYGRLDRLDEAIEALDQSVALMQRDLGENHPSLISTLGMYSGLRQRQGDLDGALKAIERAIYIAELEDSPHYLVPRLHISRGGLLVDLGRAAEAIEPLEEVVGTYLASQEQGKTTNPNDLAGGKFALARALWEARDDKRHDPERAMRLADEALVAFRGSSGSEAERAEEVAAWMAAASTDRPDSSG